MCSGAHISSDEYTTSHFLLRVLNGKLLPVLISDIPQNVLDVGTGPSTWVIEHVEQYPSAGVIGIDLFS